ncbi:NtaA/DmoA family FMN-dependent monooxygenase [Dactylosporangium sp. NPDC051484]|uniref:NtaA/DmoA family FMN-dependent monooxygenase n=1 Tax=Dactylosporangium sp. NPDC051484 TaxID=3154942 RepID=UPI00344E1DBB
MSQPKQVRLAINLLATGRHNASWKTLPDPETLSTDIDVFIEIAKTAERGLIDGIFLADNHGGLNEEAYKRPFRALDPSVLLAALATHTRHIGLVSTIPALYGNPATVARQIASLDHVSKGRAAWNIITSQNDHTLRIFGLDEALPQEAKYDRAEEFVSIVTQLWDSLPAAAVVADKERTVYIDRDKLRPIDFQGEHFRAAGTLGVTAGYGGRRPVLLQAGASQLSKQFGTKWADALFTSHWTKPQAQQFYGDVKQLAAEKWHRDPAKLLVVPGVYPVLGSTEAEAIQRKADLDDQLDLEHIKGSLAVTLDVDASILDLSQPLPYDKIPLDNPENKTEIIRRAKLVEDARARNLTAKQVLLQHITGGHRIIVGTPEQVADDLLDWIDTDACDGFNFNIDRYTDGLEHLVDWLVPELQQRGRFRKEYESTTFRGNLGIDDVDSH